MLAYAQTEHISGDLVEDPVYLKLYVMTMDVCARPEIQALSIWKGKPVNIDASKAPAPI